MENDKYNIPLFYRKEFEKFTPRLGSERYGWGQPGLPYDHEKMIKTATNKFKQMLAERYSNEILKEELEKNPDYIIPRETLQDSAPIAEDRRGQIADLDILVPSFKNLLKLAWKYGPSQIGAALKQVPMPENYADEDFYGSYDPFHTYEQGLVMKRNR